MAHSGIIQSFHIQLSLRTWNPAESYCYHKTQGNFGQIFSLKPYQVNTPLHSQTNKSSRLSAVLDRGPTDAGNSSPQN